MFPFYMAKLMDFLNSVQKTVHVRSRIDSKVNIKLKISVTNKSIMVIPHPSSSLPEKITVKESKRDVVIKHLRRSPPLQNEYGRGE